MSPLFLLVAGNIIDGLKLIGPFGTPESASDFAMDHQEEEWFIHELTNPSTHSKSLEHPGTLS